MDKSKNGRASATWKHNVKIMFCDLCLRGIKLGNLLITYFNTEGWMDLMYSFIEKIYREYDNFKISGIN